MFYTVADASIKIKRGRRTSAEGRTYVARSCRRLVTHRCLYNLSPSNNDVSTGHIMAFYLKMIREEALMVSGFSL
jgi:hypothetical protein